MTDKYQFVAGFNNAGSLATLSLQPTAPCPGVLYTKVTPSLSGKPSYQGPYTELRYDPRLSTSNFNLLNTAFGFNPSSGVFSVDGTFRIRIDDNTFANFNGTIKYPERRQRVLASWTGVVYTIVNLVKL